MKLGTSGYHPSKIEREQWTGDELLKYLNEFRRFIEITGFKKVKVENAIQFLEKMSIKKYGQVDIQFFNSQLIATWEHLYFAALNALTAFKNQRNLSQSLSVETLLYASGQRQIRKAIDSLGIKKRNGGLALIILQYSFFKVNSYT